VLDGGRTVSRDVDGVAGLPQSPRHQPGHPRIVLDDEDPHGGRDYSGRRRASRAPAFTVRSPSKTYTLFRVDPEARARGPIAGRKTPRVEVSGDFIGSEEHKRLFCDEFISSHRPFRPSDIAWPQLDEECLARLRGLPIWDEAVRTETETAVKVQTLGAAEPDGLLARAISLQGYEEGRHAEILLLLTARYEIPVRPFPTPYPPLDPVWTFLRAGYSECLDSFFAFGLFDVARRSNSFPGELTQIFEPILQEEARHILFIVNWAAYVRARTPALLVPAWEIRRAWTVSRSLAEHIGLARTVGRAETPSPGFGVEARSAFGDLSAREFLELCLRENERRLAGYDKRLLRPRMVPGLVRRIVRFLRNDRVGAAPTSEGAAPTLRAAPDVEPSGLPRNSRADRP